MPSTSALIIVSPIFSRLNPWGIVANGRRQATTASPSQSKNIDMPRRKILSTSTTDYDNSIILADFGCDSDGECDLNNFDAEQARTVKILAAQEVVGSWLPSNIFEN
eukprot:CAMPEP_0196141200 /NCGR_PEP_ID=MMETSP0910-20130528/9092_1 /TAXON_ID=49265 /ORGANISM="Thalassiosira rotula, Strain GSO102" /LENGTH=106 /DNA_ID=CAMNT_0041402295 /DNA_START=112 /DNA_END=432 /DNA_ORIENTATION=+